LQCLILALRVKRMKGGLDRFPQFFGGKGRRISRSVGKRPELEALVNIRVTLKVIDQIGPPPRARPRSMDENDGNQTRPIRLKTNELG